jgi:putative transposase
MPNHVHLIAVARDTDGLSRTFRHVHRHYTGFVSARLRVTGHLWQGRFRSVAMDEQHLCSALRYFALNPVRARLVVRPQDWHWSSVRAHQAEKYDHVVRVAPALERVGNFEDFLGEEFDEAFTYAALRKAETIGHPVGSAEWMADMAAKIGQPLLLGKRGPKRKRI